MADQEINETAAARSSAQEREAARFDITIRQASLLFADLGVPRSPRSVQGFCKDGHIDAILAKGLNGDRYFISRGSIERYATELKQIEDVAKIGAGNNSAQEHEPARESAQQRATPDPIMPLSTVDKENREQEPEGTVSKLRDENLNLRIDNRGKESFINQLVQDRNRLIDAVQVVSYKLGAAESRVQQLEASEKHARISAQEHEAARGDDPVDSDVATSVPVKPENQSVNLVADTDLKPAGSGTVVNDPSKGSIWKKIFG